MGFFSINRDSGEVFFGISEVPPSLSLLWVPGTKQQQHQATTTNSCRPFTDAKLAKQQGLRLKGRNKQALVLAKEWGGNKQGGKQRVCVDGGESHVTKSQPLKRHGSKENLTSNAPQLQKPTNQPFWRLDKLRIICERSHSVRTYSHTDQ